MAMSKVRFYKDDAGEYRWMYHAGNGEEQAQATEGYNSPFNVTRAWDSIVEDIKSNNFEIVVEFDQPVPDNGAEEEPSEETEE